MNRVYSTQLAEADSEKEVYASEAQRSGQEPWYYILGNYLTTTDCQFFHTLNSYRG